MDMQVKGSARLHDSSCFIVFNSTRSDNQNQNIYLHRAHTSFFMASLPFREVYWAAPLRVITTVSLVSYLFHRGIAVLMGLSHLCVIRHLFTRFLFSFFNGGISAAVAAANVKSPSFVCLTPEVRPLCLACCFKVCPQQHGQSPFCCPSAIFVWDRPSSNDLAWSLGTGERAQWVTHYLYLDKTNNPERRLGVI